MMTVTEDIPIIKMTTDDNEDAQSREYYKPLASSSEISFLDLQTLKYIFPMGPTLNAVALTTVLIILLLPVPASPTTVSC